MAYIDGDRYQSNLLPYAIEDFVHKNDPVRAYDVIIDKIFEEIQDKFDFNPRKPGAPEYHPKTMLKVLVFSYSYGIRSSRKIERSLHHNLSYIWLSGGIKPDHWTISDFRRQNIKALKDTLKTCARMCVDLELIDGNVLFVDGSKFRANASIGHTWTQERCLKAMKRVDARIDELMDECEKTDRSEKDMGSLVKMREEIIDQLVNSNKIKKILEELKNTGKEKINTIDPGCSNAQGRQGSHASYNVQLTTDAKNGLIVSAEAVSENNDYNQFTRQMENAKETLGKMPETGCGDSGYSSTDDLEKIENDIQIIVPTTRQANLEREEKTGKGFDKQDFRYDEELNRYICPNNRILKYAFTHENGDRLYKGKMKVCRNCKYFGRCTQNKNGRTILRMRNEETRERIEKIYESKAGKEIYKHRKERAELPFGHLKRNLGAGQFMLRGREKVNAESSVLAVCFNVARMISILGVRGLMRKIGKIKAGFSLDFAPISNKKLLYC